MLGHTEPEEHVFIPYNGGTGAASEMKRFLQKECGNHEGLPVSIKNGTVPEGTFSLPWNSPVKKGSQWEDQ